jgi:parvulin-like peptidyl-prolyl isomerase
MAAKSNIIYVIFSSNTSSDPESALKKRFDPVMEKLKSGEAFETVARQYSEASSASDGGDLGKFSLDTLSGQIKKNIENLSAGDYTPILKSDKGGQIIFIEEIVQDGGKPLKTVSAEIEQKLYKEIVEKRFSEWMDGLRARSHIKIIR